MTQASRARLLFAGAAAVHLTVLYAPSSPGAPVVQHLDKAVHALVFAGVMVTGARAGVPRVPLAWVLCAHAVVSEAVQGVVLAARSADPWDAVADVAGVALGLAALTRRVAGNTDTGQESMPS